MSIQAIDAAIQTTGLKPAVKLLAIVIANYTNDKDYSYASYETMMRLSGIKSKTSIAGHLKTLEEIGMIKIENRGGTSNLYHFLFTQNPKIGHPKESENTSPKIGHPTQSEEKNDKNTHLEPVQKLDTTSPKIGQLTPQPVQKLDRVVQKLDNHSPKIGHNTITDTLTYTNKKNKQKKKSVKISELTQEQKALCELFNRKESTGMSYEELRKSSEMNIIMSDIETLAPYYDMNTGSKYRRKSLLTLLNNWHTELDRSRSWTIEQQREQQSTTTAKPSKWAGGAKPNLNN